MAFSVTQLSQHVEKALAQAGAQDVLAYAWPGPWNDGESLQIGEKSISVCHCDSTLRVREALVKPSDQPRVLLVGCDEAELGQDVLARLFRHRLLHVDRWQMVMEAFGAVQVDPRLYEIPWMPDALLDVAPRRRVQPLTVLTYERALRICLSNVLGTGDREIDLETLLVTVGAGSKAWSALTEKQREVYQRYLADQLGPVASAVIGAVNVGNAHAVLSIGLVCEVLFGGGISAPIELRDARVRLEPRLGGFRVSQADGQRWAEAAKRVLRERDDAQRHSAFHVAVDLLKDLGAEAFLAESSVLPQALDRRLEGLAEAVRAFLKKPSVLPDVEQAAARVLAHEWIPAGDPAPETARMMLRLCRREARLADDGASRHGVQGYLEHGAWEDWARRNLRGVRPAALARAADELLECISKRRQESDRRFAEDLAQRLKLGTHPERTLPVEQALEQLAAPIAAESPVLIIVLDGMSWDVYLSIAMELSQTGWTGWKREGLPVCLLATVPSVTEYSRASLLAGRLMRGASGQEKQAFAKLEGLKRVSRGNRPPMLLHKAELQDGNQLSHRAADLLADPEQRVVGVVINAIDDALAKSEQVRIDWSVEAIPLLGAILAQSRNAGRAVLITSDHGHVVERGAEHRNVSEAERWRPAGDPPASDEILVEGPRVTLLMGAPVIVPWSENLRYSTKKNGYHGGATQQEMLVPVGIWTSGADRLPGCVPEYIVPPPWWATERGEFPTLVAEQAAPDSREAQRGESAGAMGDLFATSRQESSWIGALLESDGLKRQRERVGRLALDDERLNRLLLCLDQYGGRASVEQLASAIQQPLLRMRGVLSVFQRMLNIDGYPVAKVESGTQTVFLDVRLLRTQFDL